MNLACSASGSKVIEPLLCSWACVEGIFDALSKKYLRTVAFAITTDRDKPDSAVECYNCNVLKAALITNIDSVYISYPTEDDCQLQVSRDSQNLVSAGMGMIILLVQFGDFFSLDFQRSCQKSHCSVIAYTNCFGYYTQGNKQSKDLLV
jgi:hypothetical protein